MSEKIHCVYIPHVFISSSIDRYMAWYYKLAIKNSIEMNIDGQIINFNVIPYGLEESGLPFVAGGLKDTILSVYFKGIPASHNR